MRWPAASHGYRPIGAAASLPGNVRSFLLGRSPRSVITRLAAVALALIALIVICSAELREGFLDWIRPGWFYVGGLTRYDFRPTPLEQACLEGTAPRINGANMTAEIPKIVHFAWSITAAKAPTMMLWLAVRAASYHLGSGADIRVHVVHDPPSGAWWDEIKQRATIVNHDLSFLDEFTHINPPPAEWDVAHQADVLRLKLLVEHGGVWLDTDAIVLRPLDALFSGCRDVVMGYEGGHRKAMANSVIFAKRGAPFVERWLARYDSFDPNVWDYHSVILPAALAREHPDEICRLSPAAFFWPLWTDSHVAWMHAPLGENESARVAAAIHRNDGALYDEQVIYHAQNHAAARFMKHLTVEDIRTKNTRFNMLVRRYINM